MELKNIVIHCSDSTWGSAAEIRRWHLERGWADIGYHLVILNGRIKPDLYIPSLDGSIEVGRPFDGNRFLDDNEIGAHALGYNAESLGIDLIGKDEFTPNQLARLFRVCNDLQRVFWIEIANIFGHYELDPRKTCPNINMVEFRKLLSKGAMKL